MRYFAAAAAILVMASVLAASAELDQDRVPDRVVIRFQPDPRDRYFVLVPSLSEIAGYGSFLVWETPHAISLDDIREGLGVHVVKAQHTVKSLEALWWFFLKHGLYLLLDPSLTELKAYDHVNWSELTRESWAFRDASHPMSVWSHAVIDVDEFQPGRQAMVSALKKYLDRLSDIFEKNICLDFAMGTRTFPGMTQVQMPRIAVLRALGQDDIERFHRNLMKKSLMGRDDSRHRESPLDYETAPLEALWARHLTWPLEIVNIVEVDTKRNLVIFQAERKRAAALANGWLHVLESGNSSVMFEVMKIWTHQPSSDDEATDESVDVIYRSPEEIQEGGLGPEAP